MFVGKMSFARDYTWEVSTLNTHRKLFAFVNWRRMCGFLGSNPPAMDVLVFEFVVDDISLSDKGIVRLSTWQMLCVSPSPRRTSRNAIQLAKPAISSTWTSVSAAITPTRSHLCGGLAVR